MKTSTAHKQAQTGFETIFVALGPSDHDRSERLAEKVIDLAGPSGAQVVLGHVFTKEEYEERREMLNYDPDAEVTPDVVAQRFDVIRDIGEHLDAAGIDHTVRGGLGEYSQGIADLAEEEDADLVVVGGRKRSPTGKAVFGSTAQEVMLTAHCPVTFVRADAE
ncbi:universal stress protein [Haloarchaeobius sp. HME9146]|uniref:universal stress protein n=1 Tax=Haloarchaeobius sp. HME9146 TaxID=2978732 RepID=UPI0021C1C88C|nr:universal stress protein [Haloarchaeobius sp. HME9146]MCT9095018.1 universal stress protein [Haloarchaeobius sp. HME9146]